MEAELDLNRTIWRMSTETLQIHVTGSDNLIREQIVQIVHELNLLILF